MPKFAEMEDINWVLYKDRPEWSDVTPIQQEDGGSPVVRIAYSDKFRDVHDYLRAILKSKELSDRVFQLNTDAVNLNAASYTVWQLRRELLKNLNMNMEDELEFITQIIFRHLKNYQIWHHRKVIVEHLNNADSEATFLQDIFDIDSKNYHAWQHRQWVVRHFKLFENELQFVNSMIADDIRNNSAWNHRYYIIENTTGFTADVITNEITYALDCVQRAPNNESAWNYIRGVIQHGKALFEYAQIVDFCNKLYEKDNRCPQLLMFLVDIEVSALEINTDSKSHYEKAINYCQMLANAEDTIRSEYWQYRSRCIVENYEKTNKKQ